MSYTAAVDHLYALGHELAPTTPSAPRRKFDLAHMRVLTAALGDPQHAFPSILIAGTNGKGSTAATLSSILTAASYRTALYTSPHLIRVNERIQIDGHPISDADFARLYFHVDDTAQRLVREAALPQHPSFFETLTALAFLYYADKKTNGDPEDPVDIAVLEVGMGGRLDATNIVDPLVSVITDIALDHQDYLGNTIAEIAREKAGILRPNGTLITLPQHPEANQAIGEAAASLNLHAISAANFIPPAEKLARVGGESVLFRGTASAVPYPPDMQGALAPEVTSPVAPAFNLEEPLSHNHYTISLSGQSPDNALLDIDSPLSGHHQQRNIALAVATAIELRSPTNPSRKISNQNSYKITNANIERGIRNTHWPGRLEFLPPNILLDVAHNPAGAWTLRAAIAQLPEHQPRTLLFSCLRDKSLKEISQILFPLFDSSADRPQDHIVFAPINNPRASSLDDLLAAAHSLDIPAQAAPDLAAALAQARAITPPNGLIIATGSIYLVGEIRRLSVQP